MGAPQAPIARAGADQTLPDTNGVAGEAVTLSGTASTDADGTIASYPWTTSAGASLGSGATLTRSFPDGVTDVVLTVTDNAGLTSTDSVRVTVTAAVPRRPPVANAGPDQSVVDSDAAPGESVTLSASGSTDPDGNITTYVWTNGEAQLGTGVTLTRRFPTVSPT